MPRTIDREQKRDEIAESVLSLVGERGLEVATMRGIARASGYTLGALPYYFRDKNDIMLHALRFASRRANARMTDPSQPHEGLAGLTHLLESALPLADDSKTEWWLWQSSWSRSPLSRRIAAENRKRYANWGQLVWDHVASAQATGELPPGVPTATLARHVVVLVDGLGLGILRDPQTFTPEVVRRHIAETYVALNAIRDGVLEAAMAV